MNYVFLMDPLSSVVVKKDTSLALMVGARRKGHNVYFLPNGGIILKSGSLHFRVLKVTPQYDVKHPFIEDTPALLDAEDVHVIFIRTDPPFNEKYLRNTWLLDLLPKHIPVINTPSGIRTVNEKIWVSRFTSIVPKTLISSSRDDLLGFLREEKDIIAKPTDSYGGQSVFHIMTDGQNTNVILETLTQNWRKDIILQKYIPDSLEGDKRILLLDGKPLGAVLRLHSEDDHRNNFFSGGKPLAVKINRRDQEIIDVIKPELKKLGLYFVGIDIIGDYLIEVNVTSPTCLQEMNQLYDRQLEYDVISFSEELVEQFMASRQANT
ncbi:MAG: glutathione synthase [Candidatus Omnitrophica bacterium]|nr:glutathione synthase [Candidatus Omnitrophota bacterium]